MVRSSPYRTPASAAAQPTPYPSIPSATASGWRAASVAARSAVPVTVVTVSTSPSTASGSAAVSAASTDGSTVSTVLPKPSWSSDCHPSGDSAPRSACTLRRASTVAPMGAGSGHPRALPAGITTGYGRPAASASPSRRAVRAAAAAGPTPTVPTVMSGPVLGGGSGSGPVTSAAPAGRPASTASRSAITEVVTRTRTLIRLLLTLPASLTAMSVAGLAVDHPVVGSPPPPTTPTPK